MTNKKIEPPRVLEGKSITDSQAKGTIEHFLNEGLTNHSRFHDTLAYVIDHCEREGINYRLSAYPGKGYEIRILPPLD